MRLSKTLLPFSMLLGLSACVAPPEKTTEFETIKPGAAISLSHVSPQNMGTKQYQTVRLQIDEAYDDGQMTLNIAPSEGLSLFGGVESKTFNMNELLTHEWPIDVRAETDGIYFLNVFASTGSSEDGISDRRSFSIRLDIGDITPEMRQAAFPENGVLSNDGETRILEATETIR